ncbi:MAG: hypothetical protein LM577_08195 [Thermoproteaceae archaeon]|jgi:hypothetical protein|nr:hypothetical protein [Thermoproteaceae archaeon]
MWRLVLDGGKVRRVEEPALEIPPGWVGVRVKAFLIDDFSFWALRRGSGPISRWAFGVIVSGGEVGQYVIARAENAAAQFIATGKYVRAESCDPSILGAVHAAYVLEALRRIPRFLHVEILGDDPRRAIAEQLVETGRSRWKLALQGAVIKSGIVIVLSRIVEAAGSFAARFIDVPSARALREAIRRGLRLQLPVRGVDKSMFDGWGIVSVE